MKKIKLITSDGVKIIGNFSEIENSTRAILLLHMMPKTKESWDDFVEKLNNFGYTTLSIDLRGHGESQDGPEGYKNFIDQEHQASYLDVEISIEFLEELGIENKNISIMGASIGANLALDALAQYSDIKKAILLSPGLNYKGLLSNKAIADLADNQKILLIASEDDKYSYESIIKLKEIKENNTDLIKLTNAGHGTDMFLKHPELMDEIIKWLN